MKSERTRDFQNILFTRFLRSYSTLLSTTTNIVELVRSFHFSNFVSANASLSQAYAYLCHSVSFQRTTSFYFFLHLHLSMLLAIALALFGPQVLPTT